MKNINSKYTFKRADSFQTRMLCCPGCFENLSQQDIENYSRCPYCNYHFKLDKDLEDFILQPVIEHWMRQNQINLRPETF